MGVVWEARHLLQDVRVAIKIITSQFAGDDSFRAAFQNEVRAVAKLHHPSIIMLLDSGVTSAECEESSEGAIAQNSLYFAMELANSETLPRPKTPLPWRNTKYILLELLDALAHAHARNVIHRDIKPSNVLLMTDEAGRTHLKLTDFGIAKALGSKELPSGTVAGTPRYMSPEQILNQTLDQGPWTDLYSLGCLAYQFAAGRRIFANAVGTDVLRYQLHEQPEPVLGAHLPQGFQGWLDRMLAKKIRNRFQFAAEAAWELAALPEPELAEPLNSSHSHSQLPQSADSSVSSIISSEVSINSYAFHKLFAPQEASDAVDISDELLNDFGDTQRMDQADIALALSRHTSAGSRENVLSTLAEIFQQHPETFDYDKHFKHRLPPTPGTWKRSQEDVKRAQLIGAGLGLWGLRYIPLVDRDQERDTIYKLLLKAKQDFSPQCLLIDGNKGSGKSRLVEWMTQRVHELALANTIKALHYPEYQNTSGLARSILHYLQCQNLTRAEALKRVQSFMLEHPLEVEFDDALPLLELMQLPDDPQSPVVGIHFDSINEQFAVILRFLQRLCSDRPCILWLDDIHWSPYVLAFIDYVFEDLERSPFALLIVATLCNNDIEENSQQSALISHIKTHKNTFELVLSPLAAADHLKLVQQLLGLDDELSHQVATRTSGNPLFAIQLIGDWVERGYLVPGPQGFILSDEQIASRLPDSLHELWLSRLRLIFKDTKRLQKSWEQLELAACLGNQFDAEEWRICCELAELGANDKTLQLMLEHQLFELRYPNISFAHNLLRESLIRYTKENGRFKQHHLVCADMLQQYFSEALVFYHERRAQHLFFAESYEACIEPLLQAATIRQQRCEFRAAHELFAKRTQALDLCSADSLSPIRALGWVAQAKTYVMQTQFEDARSLIEQALELGEQTQSLLVQALAHKELGALLYLQNNTDQALESYHAALAFFEQISARRRKAYLNDKAAMLSGIGRICLSRHDIELSQSFLTQAIDIQTQTGDQFGLGVSYKLLANGYQHTGNYEQARQNLEFALDLFERTGRRQEIAHVLNDIGEIYRLGYKLPEQAEEYYRNAIRLYHEIGATQNNTPIINLGLLLLAKQRYAEAKTLFQQQLVIVEQSGSTLDLNWFIAGLLPCCAATFDWPSFESYSQRLAQILAESRVIDADILYCTELATQLCHKYATPQQAEICSKIALQQAAKLGDSDAATRINALIN